MFPCNLSNMWKANHKYTKDACKNQTKSEFFFLFFLFLYLLFIWEIQRRLIQQIWGKNYIIIGPWGTSLMLLFGDSESRNSCSLWPQWAFSNIIHLQHNNSFIPSFFFFFVLSFLHLFVFLYVYFCVFLFLTEYFFLFILSYLLSFFLVFAEYQ